LAGGDDAAAWQGVVLGEVAGLGATLRDGALELLGGGFGDVLIEPAAVGAGDQDATHVTVLQRPVGERVLEGAEQVGGVVALTQQQNLASVVARRAWLVPLEGGEVLQGRAAEVLEGEAQLVEVRATLGMAGPMTLEGGAQLSSTRQQGVASDAGQVGTVDEELVLGHSDRQDLGHVLVG